MSNAEPEPSIEAIVARLRAAGCVFAEDEARILIDAADDEIGLEQLVVRRVAGEPLEYIVGGTEFGGLMIAVAPGVFVPRQRSLLLVETVIDVAGPTARILDLCCGSAALAAVVADRLPDATVAAADIDPIAVACAELNLAGRGQVYRGDLFSPLPSALRGALDVVVCNAPYVPTAAIATMPPEARDHERRATLDGGEDGLDLLRRVAVAAPHWLSRPGHLVMEIGDSQVDSATTIFSDAGFTPTIRTDRERGAIAVVGSVD
ncbi:putative protein N(5)-glutamine methyltransferase [Williamsia sp. 1135]|uniref:putative protein N(5)-glutamine methyltransferase n=1 Tax=Williamsia sp. 1135 TaxID=1889262 RepID=UPI000A10FE76|nr:putative protein N(5)-glutamine methyltransferase [Williamsia sp. 1135]ORM35162.1 methylase [Williamsia sp. 1135]